MPKSFTGPAPIYRALLPSPFQMIQFGERARQQAEEREMKRLQQVREENSRALDKAFDYKANPVISQYQSYFDNQVNMVYEKAKPLYYSRDPETKNTLSRTMSEIDGQLNIVKDMEQQINTIRTLAKDDKRYDPVWINNNLYTTIYDERGGLLRPEQLDPTRPATLLNDYRAYNIAGLNEDFAKGIDENVTFEFGSTTQGGVKFLQKFKKSSKLVQLDNNGNPVYDKSTGRLQLNVTPELVNRYLQDDGRKLWAEQLVKEKQESGVRNYTLSNAVEDLLSSNGYYKRALTDQEVLDKSQLNLNFIGGSAETDRRHRAAAEYFYNLIHGDDATRKSLLGDISSGKDFAATYQKEPKLKSGEDQVVPSKRGYIVIDYDPLSRFGDLMDKLMETEISQVMDFTPQETRDFIERARKDHKILINLDDEEGAWRELNQWRNLARNQDVNSDFLKQAYDELSLRKRSSPGRYNRIGQSDKGTGGIADNLIND